MSINKTSLIGVVVIAMVLSISFSGIATAWPPNLPPYDECHGVVIGVSEYVYGPSGDRGACTRDAGVFYWELRDTWGMFAPIVLLTDSAATEDAIDNALDNLANVGDDDLVVVYISAEHFDNAPDEENFGTYDWVAYSSTRLAQKLSQINAEATVVVLDFCKSGSFEDEMNIDDQVTVMACESDELAWGRMYPSGMGPRAHSTFSYYLNQHPDVDGNGVVEIEEVFGHADPLTIADVAARGHDQHPVIVDNVPGNVAYLDAWG